ncbi:hypothetical protein C8R43DRAFT_150697 [Mycena crocata]|nr:hypothetical protein C8R43DRAFT_150697 [Mycena crocata]
MEEDPTVLTPTGASTPLTLLTFPPRRRIFYRGAVAKVAAARMAKGKGKGLESPPLSLRERSLIRTAKMANLVAPDHLRFTIVSLKATGKPHLLPLLPPPDAERVEALIGTSIDVDAPAPDKRAHEDNGSAQGGNPSKKIKTEGTEVFGKKGRSSSSSGSRSVIPGPANHKKPPCGLKRQKACDLNLVVRLQKQLQAEVGDARRAPLGIGAPPAAAMPLHNGKVFRFGQGSSQGPFPIPSFHCSAEAFRVEETPLATSQDSEMDIDTIAAIYLNGRI